MLAEILEKIMDILLWVVALVWILVDEIKRLGKMLFSIRE